MARTKHFSSKEDLEEPAFEVTDYADITRRVYEALQAEGVCSSRQLTDRIHTGIYTQSNIDFDQLFIEKDITLQIEPSASHPGYYHLRRSGDYLYPITYKYGFKSYVQKAIDCTGLANQVRLANHGPAVQMDFCEPGMLFWGNVLYSVVVIFCLESSTGHLFIPKSPDGLLSDQSLWRRSVIHEPRHIFNLLDCDEGVARLAEKIFRAATYQAPKLSILPAFIIEQALLHEQGAHTNPQFWTEQDLENILRAILVFVGDAVLYDHLTDYVQKGIEAPPSIDEDKRAEISEELMKLAQSPRRLLSIKEARRTYAGRRKTAEDNWGVLGTVVNLPVKAAVAYLRTLKFVTIKLPFHAAAMPIRAAGYVANVIQIPLPLTLVQKVSELNEVAKKFLR